MRAGTTGGAARRVLISPASGCAWRLPGGSCPRERLSSHEAATPYAKMASAATTAARKARNSSLAAQP